MTDGPADKTHTWAKRLGVKYAYGFDSSQYCLRQNVFVYPFALLVDASGVVVWRGKPGDVTGKLLTPHLAGTLTKPLCDWPEELDEVVRLLRHDRLAMALSRCQAITKDKKALASYPGEVQKLISASVAGLETLLRTGDFAQALERGERIESHLGKLPEATRVKAVMKTLRTSEAAKAGLKQQAEWAAIEAVWPKTRKDVDAQMTSLTAFAKKHEKSVSAHRARLRIGHLKKLIEYGLFE